MKTATPSCLWKLEFSKSKIVHLFGSIHLPVDSIQWNRKLIFQCIEKCDHYFGEMNLDEIANMGMKGANILPQGKKVSDLFPSYKKYEKVRKAILKSFEVDLDDHPHLKPMLFQHMLDHTISNGKGGILDQELWDHARKCGKTLDGLESAQDQLNILKSIDLDYQVKVLRKIASNTKTYHKRIKGLIKLYNKQDIRQLYLTSSRATGKYRELMIYSRNKKMAQRISILPQGNYFVSVGVGHLYGNSGLLAYMKRLGWTMQSVQ